MHPNWLAVRAAVPVDSKEVDLLAAFKAVVLDRVVPVEAAPVDFRVREPDRQLREVPVDRPAVLVEHRVVPASGLVDQVVAPVVEWAAAWHAAPNSRTSRKIHRTRPRGSPHTFETRGRTSHSRACPRSVTTASMTTTSRYSPSIWRA
jgi:hypothetical protein